jgi:ABC-2 type transport system permease protein
MFFYQLKGELWKLFGKKRTYLGFLMLLLAQLLIASLLRFYPPAHRSLMHTVERSGFGPGRYLSMLTVATVMVVVLAYTMLPLYVALIGGDLVSKEAEDGTLRMILARPVSRVRLLCLKWLAGSIFSVVLVLLLMLGGLLCCGLFFPATGGLFVQVPGEDLAVFDFAGGLEHFLLAHLFLIAKAITIMSLAFMFSCFNMKPAAAAILALSLLLLDRILMEIPYFHDLTEYFVGYHLNSWQTLFQEHIPWWRIGESLGILFGLSLSFLIVGTTVFQVRDIKS